MKRISIIRSIAAIVLTVGSGALESATPDVYDPSFDCVSGPLSLRLPRTYPGLLAIGKIVRIADGNVQDYKTYKATQRGIELEGLTITAYTFSNDPDRYLLSSVVIADSRWEIGPLRVGQLAQSALKHAGWPEPPVDGSWELAGDSQSVSINIKGGRIFKVAYHCDAE